MSNDWLINPSRQALLDEIDARLSNLRYATTMGKSIWGKDYEHDDLKLFEAIKRELTKSDG